ncbi:DUF3231 family protein [Halalkalibacter alkaliphilus]|uniref:DUF3231 family protein n=1 Tax=Halalkalibacter alkaliphilus TaxID=2917993 RepID=UPI003083FAE5
MSKEPELTSSEIGTLWMTYQQKTMLFQMLSYFINKSENRDAKKVMISLSKEIDHYVKRIEKIFETAGAVIPQGYKKQMCI